MIKLIELINKATYTLTSDGLDWLNKYSNMRDIDFEEEYGMTKTNAMFFLDMLHEEHPESLFNSKELIDALGKHGYHQDKYPVDKILTIWLKLKWISKNDI